MKFNDVENPAYYNIQTFKMVDGISKKIWSDDAEVSKRPPARDAEQLQQATV
jgi:hypothetical protein